MSMFSSGLNAARSTGYRFVPRAGLVAQRPVRNFSSTPSIAEKPRVKDWHLLGGCADSKMDWDKVRISLAKTVSPIFAHPKEGVDGKGLITTSPASHNSQRFAEDAVVARSLGPHVTVIAPHKNCAGDPNTPPGQKANRFMIDTIKHHATAYRLGKVPSDPHIFVPGVVKQDHSKVYVRGAVTWNPEDKALHPDQENILANIKKFPGVKIQTVDAEGKVVTSEKTPRATKTKTSGASAKPQSTANTEAAPWELKKLPHKDLMSKVAKYIWG